MPNVKKTKPKKKTGKPLRDMRVLRNKDPKKSTTNKSKDGQKFSKGKAVGGKPKPSSKANLVCRQFGPNTVCFDKGKPKRADGKKVKRKGTVSKKKKKCGNCH